MLENIRTPSFRPEDVKIIIHSHGHFDHFGCPEASAGFKSPETFK